VESGLQISYGFFVVEVLLFVVACGLLIRRRRSPATGSDKTAAVFTALTALAALLAVYGPIFYVSGDVSMLHLLDPSYTVEIVAGLAMPIILLAILALRSARRLRATRRQN
jgi:hypothetical protein